MLTCTAVFESIQMLQWLFDNVTSQKRNLKQRVDGNNLYTAQSYIKTEIKLMPTDFLWSLKSTGKLLILQNWVRSLKYQCGKGMTCDLGTGTQVPSAIGFLMIALSNFSLLFYTFISELKIEKPLFYSQKREKINSVILMIHSDTIAMGDILISRMKDRQMLVAEGSNNFYET